MRQVGSPVVAARDAVAADVELAADAHRDGLLMRVEHVDLRVGDRPADRHRILVAHHAVARGPDGRLGRAVHVGDAPVNGASERRGEPGWKRLAADEQVPQAPERKPAIRIAGEDAGERRRALQVRHPVPFDGHRNRVVIRIDGPSLGHQIAQRRHPFEAADDLIVWHAEVDEAGHLLDPGRLDAVDHRHAGLRRPEQAAGFVVALEGVLEQRRRDLPRKAA